MKIFENDSVSTEVKESEIFWLKIFTQKPSEELFEVPKETKAEIRRLAGYR